MNLVIIVAKQNITKIEIAKMEIPYDQYQKNINLQGIHIS